MGRRELSTPGTAPACVPSSDRGSLAHSRYVRLGVAEGISIYLKDLSDPMRNLCLCVHDCLFDRKSIQSVVCLVASAAATIRFRRLIEGTPKNHRSLARNIPSQICYRFPRPIKNIFVRKSSTQTFASCSILTRFQMGICNGCCEFFQDVVKPNYAQFVQSPDNIRLLWNVVVSMNTVPEFLVLHRLRYPLDLSRKELDAGADRIRNELSGFVELQFCANALKHVRKISGSNTKFELQASSTGLLPDDNSAWYVAEYDLAAVVHKAFARLQEIPELN